jgi:hypothetical protein
LAVAVALALVAGVACSDGDQRSASNTPQVTADPAARETLGLHALRAEDLRALPGMADAVERPPERAPVFENPDPRGPCGGRAPQPPGMDHAALVTLRAGSYQVVEVVSAPPPGDVARYLDVLAADLRTGCPPFESTTNQGQTQRVSGVTAVDVAGVGDRAVAWTALAEVGTSRANAGLVALRAGPRFAYVQVFSAEAPPPATMRALAEAAARRLAG